jgi:heavy metal translocating P-type ATPase
MTSSAPRTAAPETTEPSSRLAGMFSSTQARLAVFTLLAIMIHLALWIGGVDGWWRDLPVIASVVIGGIPLIADVARQLWRRQAGADLLAAISIVASAALGEWLVGAIIVLMLTGGEALESTATRRASAVLAALAKRSPSVAHRLDDGAMVDIAAAEVAVGDTLVVLPHELCPVDGEVVDGHGTMDESFLTGEPYVISKGPGSEVLAGAVNGESVLTVVARKEARDSRYATIVGVLEHAEAERPPIRRLADRLGGWYTAVALAVSILAWVVSGEPSRFLAVLVIATPCPLLIGIPVAIIGAISLAAKHGVIIKNPAMLEDVSRVRTVIFDKTGTLTYGKPRLTEVFPAAGFEGDQVLRLAASIEVYSRHPLASAIVEGARERHVELPEPTDVSERPGEGLVGHVDGREVTVTGRRVLSRLDPDGVAELPVEAAGLECVVLVDGRYAATMRFRDTPRESAAPFVGHLDPRHRVDKTMIMSGDRETEVRYVAELVGVDEVYASVSPEGKLTMVQDETAQAPTLFLGDGINDAPAMTAATVGVALGRNSDITAEAADAVILDTSLHRLDELLHIGERMRRIALQSAIGGIALSIIGMGLAAFGLLPPLAGAVLQEVIDLAAILNAARVGLVRTPMADFDELSASR